MEDVMILRQFLHVDPVAASYLFGCGGKASAAVVDPLGDVAPYLRAAEATGMRIRYVVDTHLHADHLSAGRTLAEEAGAEYVLFAKANATFPFRGVLDGDVWNLETSPSKSCILRDTHPNTSLCSSPTTRVPMSLGSYSPVIRSW
jgi:glyoxylase-like metal-dependent hydrolase (beta-lactamase superfamily II)